jgi:hypothetical protein
LLSYVYTNPPPGTYLGEHDIVYAIAASDSGIGAAVDMGGRRRRDTDVEDEDFVSAATLRAAQ